MSNDMSMFRKMKERITDEVSSATNRLQNMQIIDQLASSISQQMKNDITPTQLVPQPHNLPNSSKMPINSQFSLIDDGPIDHSNEEDELNSELSPQHQLFNEYSIKRLNQSSSKSPLTNNNGVRLDNQNTKSLNSFSLSKESTDSNSKAVINIYELSSDIEEGLDDALDLNCKDDGLDVEIDLLSDKPVHDPEDFNERMKSNHLTIYKTKYRDIVHDLRKMHQEFQTEKLKSQSQCQELSNQINALKMELELAKQQLNVNQCDSLISNSTISENSKIGTESPQPVSKSTTKLKDLEKLLAKCKESLKLKNSQIKTLKATLGEVEKFKDYNQELRRELSELKEAHEFWTVSIAENKRIMHQEIEDKNSEMERLRYEINDLQHRLTDSHNNARQLKGTIQDLESRLVRTSAAHQKERESLTKELTAAKNNAIRQVQKESELNIERVKLDLEKSIEALKQELLNKDEQIIKGAERQQQLHEQNKSLLLKIDDTNKQLQAQIKQTEEAINDRNLEAIKCSELNLELENLKNLPNEQDDLRLMNKELLTQVKDLESKLKSADAVKCELDRRLNELDENLGSCKGCEKLQDELGLKTEKFQQDLHELTTRLNLMTTANEDQEKEIKSLISERNSLNVNHKSLKTDFEELSKKNESLSRIIQENETDMQSQQEQLDGLVTLEHELDNMKKENALLVGQLSQYKNESTERNLELTNLKNQNEKLGEQLVKFKTELENTQTIVEELRKEKNLLIAKNESFVQERKNLDEQMVVRILATMKNLETPNSSPGSDKSYASYQDSENREERNLPDPIVLIEEMSSLAFDKSNSYMTTAQRLQAVLLENSVMGEELRRLKDELNNLNRESNLATQCSLGEVEKLRTENQALVHDQHAYDERIASLEEELENLKKRFVVKENDSIVPDSTQFEYLKNIGKEPLVLARVISAVFRFEKNQIEQICRVQEAIHSVSKQTA